MKPEDENIEALSRAILRDARAEAEEIHEDGRTKAEAIRQRAQLEAEAERKAILERAQQDAERLRSQAVATAQLKARTSQLEHREKLLDKVFDAARGRLSSLQKRADFSQVAEKLLSEGISQLNATSVDVRADAATQSALDVKTLERVSKQLNAKIAMGKALETGTGIVVDTSDGRLHYDNTLETRLNRLQGVLRSAVYQVLMGEKL
jgi:V/A-type H+-transporting ATPase subunit E